MKTLLSRRDLHGWSWAELSRRSGVPVWKLRWWQRRLATTRARRRPAARFVPVAVVDGPRGACSPVEVVTPSGARILVPADFSAEHLRRVVEALEPPC